MDPDYAQPPATLPDFETLRPWYYHVIDLPNGVTTPGQWDLRGRVDDYLGHVDFSGKRVLEIGPAGGFLTMEMERRGANVVALEVAEDFIWDFVPFPENVMKGVTDEALNSLRRRRTTFWYTHRVFGLKAKMVYADAYNIPDLGRFDIVVLAALLLHMGEPHRVMAQCATIANAMIVTDLHYPDLDHCGPVMRFHPTPNNTHWDLWWHLTPAFVSQFVSVLGFDPQPTVFHEQRDPRQDVYSKFFTVVAQSLR
jgi:O-methyltransferase